MALLQIEYLSQIVADGETPLAVESTQGIRVDGNCVKRIRSP